MRASSHSPLGWRIGPSLAILFGAATVLGLFGSPVRAQNQPAGPPPPAAPPAQPPAQPAAGPRNYAALSPNAKERDKRNDIQRFLRDGVVPPNERASFEKYYKEYALARWTNPALLPELEKKENFNLPDCRRELRNELYLARGKAVHDELVQLALPFLTQLANQPTFYPASRYNAMLAIGELNQTESHAASVRPVPWGPALSVLVRAFADPNQIDVVRVAALVGIFRHAVLGIADPQTRDQLRAGLLTVAQTKEDPRRSAEGQVWIRARAMDVLGTLKEPGPQSGVAKALAAIVADRDDDLLARRAAARALGNLNLPAGQGLDSSQMAVGLAQLAADACAAELAKMEEEAEQKPARSRRPMGMGGPGYMGDEGYMPTYDEEMGPGPGSSGGMPMGPGYDEGGPGMPGMGMGYPYGQRQQEEEPDDTLNNRRRLKTFLNAAFLGLSGVDWPGWAEWQRNNPGVLAPGGAAGLVTAQSQTDLVQGLITQVDNLSKLCDNKEKLEREKWIAELETQLGDLTEALGAVSAPPAAQLRASGEPAGTQPPGAVPPPTAPPTTTTPPTAPPTTAPPPTTVPPPTAPPTTAPPPTAPPTTEQPAATAPPTTTQPAVNP